MAVSSLTPTPKQSLPWAWLIPVVLLSFAYGLLGLTFIERTNQDALMKRCVLMEPNLARIWSVGNVEIGLAYFGVFAGMAFFVLRASKTDRTHLTDLSLAFSYLFGSFLLDYFCVLHFRPFVALLIGDAIVMTFTLVVSQQLWFQRLLGVFVPLVFFTCGMGHFLEGLSYWKLTYPANVPWTMVTADVGFAILVNAARFPAFIRGSDIIKELQEAEHAAKAKDAFFRDVLLSATEGRLRLCGQQDDLPEPLPTFEENIPLSRQSISHVRHLTAKAAQAQRFTPDRIDALQTAVGEAAMNAIVHGQGGTTAIHASEKAIQVWITDHGAGIQMAQLPRATLERGYSTKDSLGHGFWLMLKTADQIDLWTSKSGTTIVITVYRNSPTHDFPATPSLMTL